MAKHGEWTWYFAVPGYGGAIELLDETKQKFAASFLAHRFRVRQARAESHAVDDLNKAIAVTEPGKYRTQLENQRKNIP